MKAGLRLTGGTARGARLWSVPGRDVRPALARMRVSVFEILRDRLPGARVLDLFAGNGTLGFEALSRGAASCVFLDVDARCIAVLRRNAEKLRLEGRAVVVHGSAFDLARVVREPIDLVFVDPPYALYDEKRDVGRLGDALRSVPGDPLLVVEHRPTQDLGDIWAGRRRTDRRRYGGTHVSLYAR